MVSAFWRKWSRWLPTPARWRKRRERKQVRIVIPNTDNTFTVKTLHHKPPGNHLSIESVNDHVMTPTGPVMTALHATLMSLFLAADQPEARRPL